jgi:hypothetical protein
MLELPPEEDLDLEDELRHRFHRRYQLQEIVQALLGQGDELRKPSVVHCSRHPIRGQNICVCRAGSRVWMNNLITCNSVWTCPLCSSKITERRVRELQSVLRVIDKPSLFLTLTFAHQHGDDLDRLLKMIYATWRRFRQGGGWQKLKDTYGWWADVRTTELTHGWNGWHPHMHILLWLENDLSEYRLKQLEADIKDRWLAVLEKEGGSASWDKGAYLVRSDDHLSRYLNKMSSNWDIAREIAKYPTKVAEARGSSPFQLLLDSPRDPEAADLFRTYAKAIKGHKQLSYSRSPDIRKVAGLKIMDDDEIAEMSTDSPEEVYHLDPKTFQELARRGKRADLIWRLRYLENLDGTEVEGLVADILSEDEPIDDDASFEEDDTPEWQPPDDFWDD